MRAALDAWTVGLLGGAGQCRARLDAATGELFVEFLVTSDDRLDRILALDTSAREQTHLAPLLGTQCEQGVTSLCEGLRVAGSYDLAFGPNQESRVADIRDDPRDAASQRLADGIWEAFTVRR